MKKMRASLCLLLCLALALLCGCESYDNFYNTFFKEEEPAVEIPRVRIGVFEPLTGADSEDAKAEIAGIELAKSLYPEVLGTEVELVYADNESDVALCPQAVESLADQGVSVILGSCKSTLSLAASDTIAKAEIPAIGITCVNPIITETNRYYFRVCSVESHEGDAAARYAYYGLGASQAAVLKQEGDDFADALAESFRTRMRSCTGSEFSVSVIEYPEGTEDFTPYLFDISTVSSGVVYFPASAREAAPVIKQAFEADYHFSWIGGSDWKDIEAADPAYAESGERYLDGACYVADVDIEGVETGMSAVFKDAWAQKYGSEEPAPDGAALGFDAYLLALEGIKMAESYTDTQSIARRLYNVYKLEGATGNISLNSKGDPIKEVSVNMISADGHKSVYVVVPNWGD